MKKLLPLFTFVLLSSCENADAQSPAVLYAENCASCHGTSQMAGSAPSLFDGRWLYGREDAVIRHHISAGIEDVGMPSFDGLFSNEELDGLVAYLKSGKSEAVTTAKPSKEATINANVLTDAVVDVPSFTNRVISQDYISGLDEPWGFVFLGPETILATEKTGALIRATQSGEITRISNVPAVNSGGQGGLLDVALDPDYRANGWIYLTYSHALSGTSGPSMTKLIRGRIKDDDWVDTKILFQAKSEDYLDTKYHYGSRITFDDQGHVYFSIGDRGKKDMAQDKSVPNGKIHRLNRDGSIPNDNPFLDGAYPSLYSYGNRNPQGLIWHPDSKILWETEHGPKGGDELNVIKSAVNYGWPEISFGINYNGTELTPFKSKPGMAQPVSQWTPSIAVCGLDVYTGDLFPSWKGRLLVGSLRYESLRLIEVDGDEYVGEAEILKNAGRIRDVTTGPDGAIYVALPTKIVRLSPKP